MITAMEIRNQQFNKSLRGYNPEEVKNFQYRLAQDFENIYSENSQLKESLQKVRYELERYHKLEETMNNSLILAQQTAEMLKINAQKEADMILEDSKKKIAEAFTVYQEIIKRLNMFNAEIKAQITGELDMLERSQRKADELSDFFFSKDVKDILDNLGKLDMEARNDTKDNTP
ncbi:DivIVA [Syntrophomonas zehnderi OL-4]|uniref:DivIVA n=1 Tax=Syntrophomonas zehnderi OL-4 TaxID=690567 RepID=A0A0E4C8P7_9FIRM|nr:DivIVA domain-containing protein [Syntrophomonas zehnderi]CFX57553.1 DivIVA [Syntrophomonas zehnderi OL-4]